jgi:N-methylhydantoinase A
MGIEKIILPKLASGLCAFGQIISDVKYNYMATAPARLDSPEAYKRIDRLFREIEKQGIRHLESDGFKTSQIEVKRSLDMRYVGQVHECTVDIGTFEINEKTIGKVKDAFHKRHEELYTYAERHNAVEVVNIESTLFGRIDKPKPPKLARGGSAGKALKGYRKAIFHSSGKPTRTPIYDGGLLGAGASIAGPAIIEEVTTTIVIEPDWAARLDASGSYVMTRKKK